MKLKFVLAAAALAAALAAPALGQTVPPLTDDIRPIRASGLGLSVSDLERSMRFYTEVLGFKVDAKVPATGPVVEYLLGFTGNTQADTLVVLRQGTVQPGATTFGRIVIVVPNGRKMAERVAAAGFKPDRIVDGTNLVRDPDGYLIELYQRPAPASVASAGGG
jgi:catechol 2,3-dioxygenase-like lactoylglutathione lyase family enzyme